MFGIGSKTNATSSDNQGSALSQIRQALSSSKNSNTSNVPMIESSSEPESLLTRKLVNTTDASSVTPTTGYSFIPFWLFSWKTLLVVIILFAIFWVIRPYVSMFNNIASMFKTFTGLNSEISTDDEKEDDDDPSQFQKLPSLRDLDNQNKKKKDDKIKQKVEGKQKKTMVLEKDTDPKPDDSASSTQGGSQGGFCLAGEWKGVRTCVQVDNKSDCMSGQLFKNEATCVTPSLRS
jgi:hypothetical protein